MIYPMDTPGVATEVADGVAAEELYKDTHYHCIQHS
jgi:hypothetical protein